MPLSFALNDNRDARLDSTYFTKEAIEADILIDRKQPSRISYVASEVKSFGAYALTNEFEYEENGIPFLRGTNYSGDFINFDGVLRISPEAHKILHKSEVKPGMVLFSMSGSVGSVAVALDTWKYPINSNQDIAKIVPNSINPYYLAAFLAGKFGGAQVKRLPVGSVQQHIFLWMIERIKVPRFNEKIENRISNLVNSAYIANESASKHSGSAETILIDALGLANWRPSEPLSYIASSADAFAAGRLDAQYFQPKFDEMHDRLKSIGGDLSMADALSLNARGRQPQYEEMGLPVINSKHVRTNRVILGAGNRFGIAEGSPIFIQKGDVLLNGTGVGTIGRVAPYMHAEKALPDNHVTVLRPKTIDPIYLSVFLNSQLGQMQVERFISGSSGQIELYPSDIAKIVVWDAPQKVQSDIKGAILSAFDQERRARELLDRAKRAVEIAIENSEAAALRFLEEAGA